MLFLLKSYKIRKKHKNCQISRMQIKLSLMRKWSVITVISLRMKPCGLCMKMPFTLQNRSSHRRCSIKKLFWIISQNLQENICHENLFSSLQLYYKIWVTLQVFCLSLSKFFRKASLQNTCKQLFLTLAHISDRSQEQILDDDPAAF